MSDDHAVDIQKHVRTYILVFAALAVLTVVTVGVYYLDLSTGAAVALALLIATVKGSLVACYFMHLISEKKLILAVLALTVSFFIVLLLLPVLTSLDAPVTG
jgi:cytochrome c oxidase subunit 4